MRYSNQIPFNFSFLSTPQQAAELIKRKQIIEEKLEKTGKKKEFEEYLKKRLQECGWKDTMKKQCMGINLDNRNITAP